MSRCGPGDLQVDGDFLQRHDGIVGPRLAVQQAPVPGVAVAVSEAAGELEPGLVVVDHPAWAQERALGAPVAQVQGDVRDGLTD